MTLDEMILEFKESADGQEQRLKGLREKDIHTYVRMKAAAKKLRLVEGWLKELKRLREEKDSDAIRCEDCVNYMRKKKTDYAEPMNKLCIDTAELQELLCSGRKTAVEVGTAAGAKIRVGRRVMWNTKKIAEYLDQISNGSGEQEIEISAGNVEQRA